LSAQGRSASVILQRSHVIHLMKDLIIMVHFHQNLIFENLIIVQHFIEHATFRYHLVQKIFQDKMSVFVITDSTKLILVVILQTRIYVMHSHIIGKVWLR
jgi:hypothetical protein